MQAQAHILILRGQIAEAQWRLEEATTLYREALALYPNSNQAHFELSRASLLLLDVDAALHHLREWNELSKGARILQRQSLNLSQNHIGQILDEFTLDRDLLDELKSFRASKPREQIGAICRTVQQNPDQTAPAICLLIALRQAEILNPVLTQAVAPNGAFNIPKRIAQYWDAPEPGVDLANLMRSWRDLHPGYEYILFNDKSARKFIANHCSSDVLHAYLRGRHPAQRADVFRLAYLYACGGFYADADDRCLAPISTIVSAGANFVAYQEDYGTLGNNFLGAVPGHPVIGLALESAALALNRGDSDVVWLSTGPGLLSRAFARIFAQTEDVQTFFQHTIVLDRWCYRRIAAPHCRLHYKRSDLHWSRHAFTKKGRRGGALERPNDQRRR